MSYFNSLTEYSEQEELDVFGDVIVATFENVRVGDLIKLSKNGELREGKFPVVRISSREEFMQRKNASGAVGFPYFVAIKAE